MSSEQRLSELAERKRMLVAQADLHRAVIQLECANTQAHFEWITKARESMNSSSPWLFAGAASAGLFAAWRGRNLLRWVPAAFTAWRWLRKMRSH